MNLSQVLQLVQNNKAHPSQRGGVPIVKTFRREATGVEDVPAELLGNIPMDVQPMPMTDAQQPRTPFVPRVAPTLDTSGSNALLQQAQAILAGLGNDVPPQIKAPNTESIALALLPALLGAGTNYIGSLGQGYMAGQNQELARIEQERRRREQNIVRQAQGLQNQAGELSRREIGLFNQENQNFRNEQDNERFREIAATNAENRATEQREKLVSDYANSIRNHLSLYGEWTQENDDLVNDWVSGYVEKYGGDPATIKARLMQPLVGAKTGAQNQRDFNADMITKRFNFDTRKYAEESGLKRMSLQERTRQFNERMKLQREFFTQNMGFKVSNFEWDKYVDGIRLKLAQEGLDIRKTGGGSEKDNREEYDKLGRDITDLRARIKATTDLEDLDKLGADLAGKEAVRDELSNLIEWTDEELAAMGGKDVQGAIDKAKGMVLPFLGAGAPPSARQIGGNALPSVSGEGIPLAESYGAGGNKRQQTSNDKKSSTKKSASPVKKLVAKKDEKKPVTNQIKVGGKNLGYNLTPKKK